MMTMICNFKTDGFIIDQYENISQHEISGQIQKRDKRTLKNIIGQQ